MDDLATNLDDLISWTCLCGRFSDELFRSVLHLFVIMLVIQNSECLSNFPQDSNIWILHVELKETEEKEGLQIIDAQKTVVDLNK